MQNDHKNNLTGERADKPAVHCTAVRKFIAHAPVQVHGWTMSAHNM